MGQALATDYEALYVADHLMQKYTKLDIQLLRQIKLCTEDQLDDLAQVQSKLFDAHPNLHQKGDYYGKLDQNQRQTGLGVQFLKDKHNQQPFMYFGYQSTGKPDGAGMLILEDDSFYFGDFKNGQPNGRGFFINKHNELYLGDWINRKMSFGLCITQSYEYRGYFKEGKREGFGKCSYLDGTVYVGNWLNDVMNGFGEMKYSNGTIYQGDFSNGLRHGRGYERMNNTDQYIGEHYRDSRHGLGKLITTGGKFEALWNFGVMSGLYLHETGRRVWKIHDNKPQQFDHNEQMQQQQQQDEILDTVVNMKSITELYECPQTFPQQQAAIEKSALEFIEELNKVNIKIEELQIYKKDSIDYLISQQSLVGYNPLDDRSE